MLSEISVDAVLSRYDYLKEVERQERKKLSELRKEASAAEEARDVIQKSAREMQTLVKSRIESVVNKCLSAVFDNPYVFELRFLEKRGKTEAQFVFSRDGLEIDRPLMQLGGGVVDVTSFALRVAYVCLKRPPLRKLMVLDEPFSKLRGEKYRNRVKGLLQSLSDELGIQFILNIDTEVYPEFELGKVVRLGDSNDMRTG